MRAKHQRERDLSLVPDDDTPGSGHDSKEKMSRTLSTRVLRPRPIKPSSTMAVKTEAPVKIEMDTITNASKTLNNDKAASSKQIKAFNTKIGKILDQGAGSKTINNPSLDVPVLPPSAAVGTLSTRNSRVLNSEQYPKVFEPDLMILVYRKSWSLH